MIIQLKFGHSKNYIKISFNNIFSRFKKNNNLKLFNSLVFINL